ncbi:MAG: methionine aminotransferase [Deltaproteobacteria bacterium]|nr:methionine aminotransferase [Deltaproteobacteria bacterium]
MLKISSKLPDVGVTIFSVMTALANEHRAINLSQGFPDFDVAPELIERVTAYMNAGANQYAPMPGLPVLREKIARKVSGCYGFDYDPVTEITVTSGATEAIFAAVAATVHRDDEVLIFEPAYDAYAPIVTLNGGIPRYIQLKTPDYRIDWDEVRDALGPKTRLLILNTPHNPTGSILTTQDIDALKQILENTDTMILSDEVYEHIIFDGSRHESIARYPELAARSFVVSSFGKTYHTTGWKIGYCLAPEALSRELQRVHQFLTFSSNTPIQHAYADFLDKQGLYLELGAFYQEKRDLFLRLMQGSRFTPIACSGTYFQLMSYAPISTEADIDFSRRITIEHGVASIPVSVFYNDRQDHHVIRFCFAKKDETLEKAAEKLCRI